MQDCTVWLKQVNVGTCGMGLMTSTQRLPRVTRSCCFAARPSTLQCLATVSRVKQLFSQNRLTLELLQAPGLTPRTLQVILAAGLLYSRRAHCSEYISDFLADGELGQLLVEACSQKKRFVKTVPSQCASSTHTLSYMKVEGGMVEESVSAEPRFCMQMTLDGDTIPI